MIFTALKWLFLGNSRTGTALSVGFFENKNLAVYLRELPVAETDCSGLFFNKFLPSCCRNLRLGYSNYWMSRSVCGWWALNAIRFVLQAQVVQQLSQQIRNFYYCLFGVPVIVANRYIFKALHL